MLDADTVPCRRANPTPVPAMDLRPSLPVGAALVALCSASMLRAVAIVALCALGPLAAAAQRPAPAAIVRARGRPTATLADTQRRLAVATDSAGRGRRVLTGAAIGGVVGLAAAYFIIRGESSSRSGPDAHEFDGAIYVSLAAAGALVGAFIANSEFMRHEAPSPR